MDCYYTTALPQAAKGSIAILSAVFSFRGIGMLGRWYPLRNLPSQLMLTSLLECQYKFGELSRTACTAVSPGVLLHSHYLLNHGQSFFIKNALN